MKSYLALIRVDLKLAFRDKIVIFFNYLFPLVFFFMFAELMDADQGGTISYVVGMVLVLGILGNGLFGAGMRAAQERETNILRRFKVVPISPTPILVASMVTGWMIYLPAVAVVLALAHFIYGMPFPQQPFSLFLLVSLGILAFRSIGLILASVVNSVQESMLLIQLFYMPMLLVSGATIPLAILPDWVQIIAQFLPATHLVIGFQEIFFRNETLLANWSSGLALVVTMFLATFVSRQLFRWDKEEKIRSAAKLWVLAALAPFLILGTYQAYSKDQLLKTRILFRDLKRSENILIRNVRVFVGDGQVIESAAVLLRNRLIDEVFEEPLSGAQDLKAEVIQGSGKTLLPGLIDVHVHLGAPGGVYESADDYLFDKAMSRALAGYLYSGVTAVKSVGDALDHSLGLRSRVAKGEWLGADFFVSGPMFTAEGGHGTEYFEGVMAPMKRIAEKQLLRLPTRAEQAGQQVRELKNRGVDSIKAILEAGSAGMLFNRMDLSVLRGTAEEAHRQNLPIVVHTGDHRDIEDALHVGADGIEHGSFRDPVPDHLFTRMALVGAAYDPTLSVIEAFEFLASGRAEQLLHRSLVQQVGPRALIEGTLKALRSGQFSEMIERVQNLQGGLKQGKENLLRAYRAGAMLVTGSDAGNFFVFHGPTVHRELQLWVEAGIPSRVALQAATFNAARLLRAHHRIGLVKKGYEVNLLLLDGNPLQDISVTERISMVIFKGERIARSDLFEQQ